MSKEHQNKAASEQRRRSSLETSRVMAEEDDDLETMRVNSGFEYGGGVFSRRFSPIAGVQLTNWSCSSFRSRRRLPPIWEGYTLDQAHVVEIKPVRTVQRELYKSNRWRGSTTSTFDCRRPAVACQAREVACG
ncbi:hypothetical protein ACFX13_019811 [Malus domestica]